ncbi:MAG: hypothetical protein SXQ77_06115 [Halobacteria archaeon]|nr:hypothetical protein [Halobacteria archaeon]
MVFDKVRDAITTLGPRRGEGTEVVMPTNPKVLKKTSKKTGLEKERIERNMKKFQEAGRVMYPLIEKKAVEGQKMSKADQVKGSENPTFLYTIDETEEVLVVGGAGNILHGIADRLGLMSMEAEAIRQAHQLAANKNGYGKHMVMDDVFIVSKRKRFAIENQENGNGDVEKNGKPTGGEAKKHSTINEEKIEEIEKSGLGISIPTELIEEVGIEEKTCAKVKYEARGGEIGLIFDHNATDRIFRSGVIDPEGRVVVAEEIQTAFGIEGREIGWRVENNKPVGTLLSEVDDSMDEVGRKIRTRIMTDEVEKELFAHLSSDHLRALNVGDGDYATIHLDAAEHEIKLVLSPLSEDAPSDYTVRIQNRGTGTEMMCFAVPEVFYKVLRLDGEKRGKIEWGLGKNELLGKVVEE